ncbi:hydrogenase maturation protease [Thermococcus siculi]|uniref:Hydrogenase maturation protease n=1 Tax=Thermococcus siculi TaxID=72803 RepID=A0A2Z2MUY9_9EURY|nr:hydrogenase maturation protease [Thermococcus siculi]ASJ07983.1 hydrogenase maturation protease [Thermococcus siculi]
MRVNEIIGDAGRIALCGVGNVERGDLGFGVYLAEALLKAVRNPSFLTLNCHDVPESQAGAIVRFRPDLLIIAVSLDFGGRPGTVVVADPWDALDDVPEEFRFQLKVTLDYLRGLLPATRFELLGSQPGSEEGVTEEVKNCVRALAIAFKDAVD